MFFTEGGVQISSTRKAVDGLLKIIQFLEEMLKNNSLPIEYRRELFLREYARIEDETRRYVGSETMEKEIRNALMKACGKMLDDSDGMMIILNKYTSPALRSIKDIATSPFAGSEVMSYWRDNYFVPNQLNINKGMFYEESGSIHRPPNEIFGGEWVVVSNFPPKGFPILWMKKS
jgi:hypothetical protein